MISYARPGLQAADKAYPQKFL